MSRNHADATPGTTMRTPRSARVARTGPRAIIASDVARKTASRVLEALSGLCTTQEAADALGVALPRYYVLETRALAGLVAALEPRRRGRQRGSAERIAELEGEVTRLERELRRFQALQRASQRALGLASTSSEAEKTRKQRGTPGEGTKAKRKRRPNRATRAERVAKGLVRGLEPASKPRTNAAPRGAAQEGVNP
jgi:hypothetical protein